MTAKKDKLNLFGRIDWNINANHRLTLRSSYLSSDLDSLSRTSNSNFNLGNNGVVYTDPFAFDRAAARLHAEP